MSNSKKELDLILAAKKGDREAQQGLVKMHRGFIRREADRWKKQWIEHDDLMQVGAIGLLRAVDTFDPDRGFRFLTYASDWIKQAIRHEAYQHIARGHRGAGNAMLSGRHKALHDAWPSAKEEPDPILALQKAAGVTEITAVWYAMHRQSMVSLDAPISFNANKLIMIDTIPSLDIPPDEVLIIAEHRAQIRSSIDNLSPRERTIINLRYMHARTLHSIGKQLGISKERVRQIESVALNKLRAIIRLSGIDHTLGYNHWSTVV